MRYTLRKNEKKRGWTVYALLLWSEPCADLVVAFGVRPILLLEKIFRIEAVAGGSSVRQGFELSGLMLRTPGRTAMEKLLTPLLPLPLMRLQQHLALFGDAPSQPRPLTSPRGGFRQAPRGGSRLGARMSQ